MKKIKKILSCLMIFCMLIGLIKLNVVPIKAYSISKGDFKPLDSNEQTKYNTNIGYWNNGGFFETITRQRVGSDPNTGYEKYRFRHYVTHRGDGGSYVYQVAQVDFYLDGKWVYGDKNPRHVSNGTYLWGEYTLTLSPGSHEIRMVDGESGAITVVGVKIPLNISIPRYTVNFVDYNGSLLKSQTVNLYGNATPPANPTLSGYTFTGWNGDYTNVRSNRTITAQYNINKYYVNFVDWNNTIVSSQAVNYGASANAPPNPTRTGYTFIGWLGDYSNVTSNRTINARYKINTYTVSFNTNGGSLIPSRVVTYGDTIQPPTTPTRGTDKFMGWYTDSNLRNKFDFNTKIENDMILYAKWDKIPVITADDIVIFVDTSVNEFNQIAKGNATAGDNEDGNITSKIHINSGNVKLGDIGEYPLWYNVTDSVGNYVEKKVKVSVIDNRAVEDRTGKYVRSINKQYLNTLKSNSIWILNSSLNQELNNTLNKPSNALPKYSWKLTSKDIQAIKEFNKTHDYSQQSNYEFLQKFGNLQK